jgi:hypothetical protein
MLTTVPPRLPANNRNWFPKHAGPDAAVRAAAKTVVSDNAYGAGPPRVVK